jgi:Cyclic nucleotide-binding domain
LDTEAVGRAISKYRMDQTVFSQDSPADAVFYIQKGKVKITVVSKQGKEAVVAILGQDEFCGEHDRDCTAMSTRTKLGSRTTTRAKPMSHEDWTAIVVSWRRELMDKIALQFGDDFVEEARKLASKGDIEGLDAELARIGFPT